MNWKRGLCGLLAPLAMCGTATLAQGRPAPPVAISADPFIETETFRLWPGRAEGATDDSAEQTPTVTVFRPQEGKANGAAVVIAPGGGYIVLAPNIEGRQVADWFASRGVTAFILKYRVRPAAEMPVSLHDGARAMRFVRANAAAFGIDPRRIGMIGFSAGGHLGAMTATGADAGDPRAADPVERVSSRPDFLILGYPWLEATAIDRQGHSPYCSFVKTACDPRRFERFMPVRAVTVETPPTFIFHTDDDPVVDAAGVSQFYDALHAKRVPAELHVFAHGAHGSGLGGSDPALARWPELLEPWLRALGVFGGKR